MAAHRSAAPVPQPGAAPAPGGPTVLAAAVVLTPSAAFAPGEVVLRGGRVAAVRPCRGPAPPPGTVLAPGFVDLQVNGAGPHAVASARSDRAWAEMGTAMAAGGTTACLPTITSAGEALVAGALRAVERQRTPRPGRPEVVGAHLEGPYLAVPGAHPPRALRPTVPPGWAAGLPGVVRAVTLAPELPGALAAVAEARRAGVLVALGHSACTAEEADAAVRAGARLVTHLGNAMGPFHHRAPGLLGVALAERRLAVSVIADGVHLHPTTVRAVFAAKGPDRVVLVTDRVADGGLDAGPGLDRGPGLDPGPGRSPARTTADGILTGTSAGMADLVARCAALPGVGLQAAVTAATRTPARLLGLADRGRLDPGCRADVVGLVAGPDGWDVAAVWIGGRRVVAAGPGGATPAVACPWWATPPPPASTR